jgi:hypothetical protein
MQMLESRNDWTMYPASTLFLAIICVKNHVLTA